MIMQIYSDVYDYMWYIYAFHTLKKPPRLEHIVYCVEKSEKLSDYKHWTYKK